MEEEDHFELTTKLSTSSKQKKFVCVIAFLATCLVITTIVIIALSAILAIDSNKVSTLPSGNVTNNTDDTVCMTPSCVDLSALVRQNMDETVEPCDDFYQFSCGGWEQKNVVPPGSGANEMASQLINRNTIALKKILDRGEDDGVGAIRKVVDLYQSCVNTTAIDVAGAQPLIDLINQTGGWSLFTGNDSGWSINGTGFVQERYFGSQAFFVLELIIDQKNSSNYLLAVQQSGLSLQSSSAYVDPKKLVTLKGLIVSILSQIDPTRNKTDFESAADGIVDFETNLAQIFQDVLMLGAPATYKLGNLSSLWPNFGWQKFMERLFGKANVTVKSSDPVVVTTPAYFNNLTFLFGSTPKNVLENYGKWQLVRGYLPYLSKASLPSTEFTKILNQQGSILGDSPGLESVGEQERYKTCIALAQTLLPIALARPFAKHILPKHTKENVSLMVDYLKGAFKERIDDNTWLDSTTKDRCKEKVDAVTSFISYPDQLFNDTYLNGIYSKYVISSNDYFGNYKRSTVQRLEEKYKLFHQKVDKAKFMWSNPPTQVNAFYAAQVNSIIILEGISRVPWFDARWPDYFKYGALGAVVGHELTHGFDNKGRNYDEDGVFRLWWTNASVKAFEERQGCFVKQYSDYKMFGYKVDGNNSLPDNIADNGGLKVGFKAYQDYVKRNPNVEKRPPPALSKYTPNQLYFISWAQVWCSLYTKEGFHAAAASDHSPGPFRVTGTVVNSPEFANTFNCPVGSKMNPRSKCILW